MYPTFTHLSSAVWGYRVLPVGAHVGLWIKINAQAIQYRTHLARLYGTGTVGRHRGDRHRTGRYCIKFTVVRCQYGGRKTQSSQGGTTHWAFGSTSGAGSIRHAEGEGSRINSV